MPTWLKGQRKGDLLQLAERAGLRNYDGLLKDELVSALETQLQRNATTLSRDPAFSEYYGRARSPTKREHGDTAPPPDATVPQNRRRTTSAKVKEELDALSESLPSPTSITRRLSTTARSLTAHSPPSLQQVTDRLPASMQQVTDRLPASPAVVADAIERQTALALEKAETFWTSSSIPELVSSLRDTLSTPRAIEALVLLVEAGGLQRETLPWRYAFDVPAVNALGTHSHAVFLPDFFAVLTGAFWSATVVWGMTSLLVPLVCAWFFNLTVRTRVGSGGAVKRKVGSEFDPVTFNVVKGLVTWLVYARAVRFGGLFSEETVARVEGSVPGGYQGLMVGAGVGVLTSFWEAVLRK